MRDAPDERRNVDMAMLQACGIVGFMSRVSSNVAAIRTDATRMATAERQPTRELQNSTTEAMECGDQW